MDAIYIFFQRGGPVMWPLLLCSLTSATVVIERIIFLYGQSRARNEASVAALMDAARRNAAAPPAAADDEDYIARVLRVGFANRDHGMAEHMEEAGYREISRMKRGMTALSIIITLAPLLGILGTVLGIIRSFDVLGNMGSGDPKGVMSGIAKAGITTATGLAITIATLVPYEYFVSRVKKATTRLTHTCTRFELEVKAARNGKNGNGGGK